MLKIACAVVVAVFVLVGCGGGECGSDFISDYNSAFVYPMTRSRQCQLTKEFKSKWAGKVCKAARGDIQKHEVTVNASEEADRVLVGCP